MPPKNVGGYSSFWVGVYVYSTKKNHFSKVSSLFLGCDIFFLMNPGSDLMKNFYFFERKFHFSTVSSLLVGSDTPFFDGFRVVI